MLGAVFLFPWVRLAFWFVIFSGHHSCDLQSKGLLCLVFLALMCTRTPSSISTVVFLLLLIFFFRSPLRALYTDTSIGWPMGGEFLCIFSRIWCWRGELQGCQWMTWTIER